MRLATRLGLRVASPEQADAGDSATDLVAVRVFALALSGLLLGYMFMGRGFAHLGFPPLYVGEMVLALGLVAATVAVARRRSWFAPHPLAILLLLFMFLGALRTLPYLPVYGLDALRDATLWGYGVFALLVYLLFSRADALRGLRMYGWIVPVFALWLPISWNLFASASASIDPTRPGSVIPLVFFKGGDMAVHTVGAVAFLVLAIAPPVNPRQVAWRIAITLPLLWTAFIAGAANRGALLTTAAGVVALVLLRPRTRNWVPIILAVSIFVLAVATQTAIGTSGAAPPGDDEASSPEPPAASAQVSQPASPSVRPSDDEPRAIPSDLLPGIGPSASISPAPSIEEPIDGDRVRIENSSFEFGGPGTGAVEGWVPFGVGTYGVAADGPYQGNQFAVINNTGRPYEATLRSSAFPVRPGEDVFASAFARAIEGRPVLELYVIWFDDRDRELDRTFVSSLDAPIRSAWRESSGLVPVPEAAVTAALLLYEAGGRSALGIDHVSARVGDFTPDPPAPEGRPATIAQIIENIVSLFGASDDRNLEGTRQFRLAWWGTIVDYTVFGEWFWTGKGFGVNLADDDGFQSTADGSLRAPHNSHVTVLARMGVPGLGLWALLQIGFAASLLRIIVSARMREDALVAALGGWLLVYWIAMMVDTSFDPYLEGPQGGIWMWTLFGVGLALIAPRRRQRA